MSDSPSATSFVEGDTELCVDESGSEDSIFSRLPFAAAMSSFRFSCAPRYFSVSVLLDQGLTRGLMRRIWGVGVGVCLTNLSCGPNLGTEPGKKSQNVHQKVVQGPRLGTKQGEIPQIVRQRMGCGPRLSMKTRGKPLNICTKKCSVTQGWVQNRGNTPQNVYQKMVDNPNLLPNRKNYSGLYVHSLAFLKALAPCLKVSALPVMLQPPSLVIRNSVILSELVDATG